MAYEFHYTPTGTGAISGTAVLEQTEDAINDLGNTAISGVQEALDKAEQAFTNSANAVDDAQTALNTANNAEGVAIQAQNDVSNLSGTVTNIGNRVTTAEDNIGNLQGRMTTAEGNIGNLQGRMTTAEGNIGNLQTAVSNAQATANTAQNTASNALTVAQNAQNDVNALGNRVTTAEGNITQNTNAITGLTTRMGTAENNITTLQNDVITAQGTATSAQNTATMARQQSYVFRYSSTALTPSSTNSNSLLDNTDNIKIGDKVLDSEGKLFALTAVDTQNSTFTIGTALIDLHSSTNVVAVGSYIQFAGSQAPEGFLVCNGGEISRTTYSALFAVIGTTYGSGDGSTTFNLPNLTDRFLQGSTTSGTTKYPGLPNITGVLPNNVGNGVSSWGKCEGALFDGKLKQFHDPGVTDSRFYNKPENFGFDASRSTSIYGNSATVQPPALTCLICIKY